MATSQTYTTIATGAWDLPTGSANLYFQKQIQQVDLEQVGYWYVTGRRDVSGGYGGIYSSKLLNGDQLVWNNSSGTGKSNLADKIWTAGNDGTGSGLDAYLLDGSHK